MKEKEFSKATEPAGSVEAFLQLDEGSDEEFLDFQFCIDDADADTPKREAPDHMADWRASFSSLQLKQAQELAEFALARRKEDELRVERQAKEIVALQQALEASKLETEHAKANFARVIEEKLTLETELAHHVRICESLRSDATKLSDTKQRITSENMELKLSLDEAAVTTGRLKVALEEKAAELVAWLGHDVIASHGPATPGDQTCLSSPEAEEKKENSVRASGMIRSDESRQLGEIVKEGKEPMRENMADDPSKHAEELLTSASKRMILGTEDVLENMKQVLSVAQKYAEGDGALQDPALSPSRDCSSDVLGDHEVIEYLSSDDVEVACLAKKVRELQLKLEQLRSLESALDEGQTDQSSEGCRANERLLSLVAEECGEHPDTHWNSLDSASARTDSDSQQDKTVEVSSRGDEASALQSEVSELRPRKSFATPDDIQPATVDTRNNMEDKFICVTHDHPWAAESIFKLVESITEELTKFLRVLLTRPSATNQNACTDLEERLKSWSYIAGEKLQSKLSKSAAVEEWRQLVADFLGVSREELVAVQQRLSVCESELALTDELQTECLASSQSVSSLTEEIKKLEAQSFSDQIEREEEVSSLKQELEQTKKLISEAQRKAADERNEALFLREQLLDSEIEVENSKLEWAAEQEFIDSCVAGEGGPLDTEDRVVSKEEMERMERRLEDLTGRLEENEREFGELLIISGSDPDAVLVAKVRRLEQSIEDARSFEEELAAEKAELVAQVDFLSVRLAEVEQEFWLENQKNVETLVRHEEEQSSTRSETAIVNSKLAEVEHLLAEKTKQLELIQERQELSPSQTQLLTLRARVLTLEGNLAVARRQAADSDGASKSQIIKEKEKFANLEATHATLQSNFTNLKTQLAETEQREKRAQSIVDKLVVEFGIAKEEVLKYEVRLQKTIRQAKDDLEAERRRHEETLNSQKQMEWHLCRQLELTEGIEREKAKLREVLVEFELQNLDLQKESDNLRSAYMQLVRQAG